jgi:hypothetical protein
MEVVSNILLWCLVVILSLCIVGLVGTLVRAVKTKHPHGYHVTFLAWKDHDFRNQGVPMQERLTAGVAWRTLSMPVRIEPDHLFVPTQMKMNLLTALKDSEITSVDIVAMLPLSKPEFEAEVALLESLSKGN